MQLKFYKCMHCGNIIAMVQDTGVPVSCCGEKMQELKAGSVDAAKEKHVPVVMVDGSKVSVSVGSVEHPMTEAHSIEWIALETSNGMQMHKLSANQPPVSSFCPAEGETLQTVYAYCNLHGLWKTTV